VFSGIKGGYVNGKYLTINKNIAISLFSLLLSLTNNAFANTSIDVGPTIGKKAAKVSVINPLK